MNSITNSKVINPSCRYQIFQRRHTDPPWLWVAMILGSVVIHLLAFSILHWLIMGKQTSDIGSNLVPVDLVAVSPKNSQLSQSGLRTNGSSGSLYKSKEKRQISTATSVATSPNRQTVLSKNRESDRKSSDKQITKNSQQATQNQSTLPNNTSKDATRTKGDKQTPPSSGNKSQAKGDGDRGGGGIVATLAKVRPAPKQGNSDPNNQVKPIEVQKEFPSIRYPSVARRNIKQVFAISAYLAIDKTGTVIPQSIEVLSGGSGNLEADRRLVTEILKSWKFEPAVRGSNPPDLRDLQVDLKVASH